MDIVLVLHSIVRFLIILVAAAGIIKTLLNLVQKQSTPKMDQGLASGFLGLYDLQALLGLLIIFLGGLTEPIHPVVMFVGIITAHGLSSMNKRREGTSLEMSRLALYIVPLLIIFVGLASIGRLPV